MQYTTLSIYLAIIYVNINIILYNIIYIYIYIIIICIVVLRIMSIVCILCSLLCTLVIQVISYAGLIEFECCSFCHSTIPLTPELRFDYPVRSCML